MPKEPVSRILTAVLVGLLVLGTTPLYAQSSSADDQRRVGLYKILIGSGIAIGGAVMAATSGQSGSITASDPFFGSTTIKASSRSTGQLIVGLAMLGGGSYLIWDGNKDRKEAQGPTSSLSLGLTPGGARFDFSRSW